MDAGREPPPVGPQGRATRKAAPRHVATVTVHTGAARRSIGGVWACPVCGTVPLKKKKYENDNYEMRPLHMKTCMHAVMNL